MGCNQIVFSLFAVTFAAIAQASDFRVLSVGRWTDWPAKPAMTISVSDGSILRVTDLGSRIKIIAKKQGTAEVRLGSSRLTVFVVSEPERSLFQTLQETVAKARGLEVKIETVDGRTQAPRIHVRGRLLRWQDWLNLHEATKSQNADYSFAATMETEIAEAALNDFKRRLREAFLPELALQLTPAAEIVLSAESGDLKERVRRVLAGFGFRISASASAIGLEPMVRVRLIVAEFRKSMMRKLGISWPATAEAQLLPALQLPGTDGLTVTVNALEDNGIAKILASPTLFCRSGKEAVFLAGGELPIKILSHKTRDIVWKKYGVLLKIRPKADFSGRMSIGIETEVSTLDTANSVDGIPGILANRIESHFDLSRSRTIVLSGLLKREAGESSTGLPGLMNLPILGPLFSSRGFRENQTELAVFVTPEIARPEGEAP